LADLLPAVLRCLDVPAAASGLDLSVSSRVCLVLVDGLGMRGLQAASDVTPFLTSLLADGDSREITSVFPSTTPIALTSLGTGLPSGEHGLVGLMLRVPETGRVVNTLALPAELDMRALQPRPTVFERAVAAGVAVTRVGPKAFDGAGLSEAGLRGGEYAAGESVGERVAEAAAGVRRGARSLTYVYLGDLDATGHRRGCASEAWRHELGHVDDVLAQLADALPAGATLLVTADHGMVDVPFANRWDVATNAALDEGVEVVAGEPRVAHVHTLAGAAVDVLAAWRETLGDAFWVMSRDEAVGAGLYGPVVAPGVRPRIGDVVAVARADSAVVDSRVLPPAVLGLYGMHGSVTEDELAVPLLVHRG
jgi:hypothetical protein